MKLVTSAQMREIDRRAEGEFGVSSEILMENAGKMIAQHAVKWVKEIVPNVALADIFVSICCGRGNNGGDGIATARYLKESGVPSKVFLLPPAEKKNYKPEMINQIDKAKKASVDIEIYDESDKIDSDLKKSVLVIDAILGIGSKGKPMGPAHKMIQRVMKSGRPILALDIPSGIDADTGYHSGVFVQAKWTVTLGLSKIGLTKPHALKYVGELIVADIGHPKALLETDAR